MAWNTGTGYSSSTALTAALINGIGSDLRAWGGNVDAGANALMNLASIAINSGGGAGIGATLGNVFSGVFQTPTMLLAQTDTATAATDSKGPLVIYNPDQTTNSLASILFASKGTNSNIYGNAQITAQFRARAAGYHSTDLIFLTGTNAGPAERARVMAEGWLRLTAVSAPGSNPASGTFYIYMDSADNKLKARGPSGTVTTIANP